MNHLAHLHLSGTNEQVIVGNFMADAVKGTRLEHLSQGLRAGVRLHRAIDAFADQHPSAFASRERLRKVCGKYAGVALDMVNDHLLAISWAHYAGEPLKDFAQRQYALLQRHAHEMPEITRLMLGDLVANDRLVSYSTEQGLLRALQGLARRAPRASALPLAVGELSTYRTEFLKEFRSFYPLVQAHTRPLQNP
jgi:acyl carrier protein phosphodiesterase